MLVCLQGGEGGVAALPAAVRECGGQARSGQVSAYWSVMPAAWVTCRDGMAAGMTSGCVSTHRSKSST